VRACTEFEGGARDWKGESIPVFKGADWAPRAAGDAAPAALAQRVLSITGPAATHPSQQAEGAPIMSLMTSR
jgi:hypothetical protein